MMDTEIATAAADTEFWKFAVENGVSLLVVIILFVGVLIWIIRRLLASQETQAEKLAGTIAETARLNGRVHYEVSRSITSLARQTRRLGEGQAATLQALIAQPARYALEKAKARDGGWTDAELAERRRTVKEADASMVSAARWSSDDERTTGDPDESIEDRIRRLRMEAELASTPDRADELTRRAIMLEAELTAQ